MVETIVFCQRFQPFSTGSFKLIGEPTVIVGGTVVDADEANPMLKQLRNGINTHSQAAELWSEWQSP